MSNKIKKIYSGKVIKLQLEQVELPNGVSCELEMIHHPGGVAVVTLNDRDEICLLHQYRHVASGWIWELPAGKLEPDEAHALTAKRELAEEAGIEAKQWTYLGKTLTSPGVFTEVIHIYLAEELTPVPQQLEETEVLEVRWLKRDKVMSMVSAGEIIDAKTLVGLLYLQQHLHATG